MQLEDIDQLYAAEPNPSLDVIDQHFFKALRVFLSIINTS